MGRALLLTKDKVWPSISVSQGLCWALQRSCHPGPALANQYPLQNVWEKGLRAGGRRPEFWVLVLQLSLTYCTIPRRYSPLCALVSLRTKGRSLTSYNMVILSLIWVEDKERKKEMHCLENPICKLDDIPHPFPYLPQQLPKCTNIVQTPNTK